MTREMRKRRGRLPITATRRVRRTVAAGGAAMALGSAAVGGGAPPAEAWHEEALPPVLRSQDWRMCPGWTEGQHAVTAFNWAIGQWDPHPELTVTANCSGFNVYYQAASYPEGWLGNNVCEVWRSDGDCDAVTMALNARILDATADPLFEWKQTACHELGHTAALGHRDPDTTSCLAVATTSVAADVHDYEAIANTYPR